MRAVACPRQVSILGNSAGVPRAAGLFDVQETITSATPNLTRTVLFRPDGHFLFLSVGSSCNLCAEKVSRRATILRYNLNNSGEEIFAKRLMPAERSTA